jgi:hypothetical protein
MDGPSEKFQKKIKKFQKFQKFQKKIRGSVHVRGSPAAGPPLAVPQKFFFA